VSRIRLRSPDSADGRDPLSFLPGVAEKLGWYVYALRDPRTRKIFYVGKGSSERVYAHARYARKVAGETASELNLSLRIAACTPRRAILTFTAHGWDACSMRKLLSAAASARVGPDA